MESGDERIRAVMGEQSKAKTSAEAGPPESRRRSRSRPLFRLLGATLLVLSLFALTSIFYLRSDRFNRTAIGFIESKLHDYGLRVEVGSLAFSLNPRTARLTNLRILNESTGELIATIGQLEIAVELTELGIKKRREVQVSELQVSGLDLFLTIDQQGRNNLEGLKRAAPGKSVVEIDFSNLWISPSLAANFLIKVFFDLFFFSTYYTQHVPLGFSLRCSSCICNSFH